MNQMATAAAIVDAPAKLSPARSALAVHLVAVTRARADFDRADRPARRLRDQLRAATEQLAAAEAALAAIDEADAAAIREFADGRGEAALPKASDRARAEAAADNAGRLCNAIRAALEECEADSRAAMTVVRDLQAQTDTLLIAALEEEHAAKLAELEEARVAYGRAEAEALAVGVVFGRRAEQIGGNIFSDRRADLIEIMKPWLQAAERAGVAFGQTEIVGSTTQEVQTRVEAWLGAVARMAAGDATARG